MSASGINMTHYSYDRANRLKSVVSPEDTTSYTYGVNNLRKSKTVNNETIGYVWNDQNMVAETDGNSIQTIHNYSLDGIALTTQGEENSFYIKNGHGDVTATSDASGNISNSYLYDAFGNQLSNNESDTNPFRYCGEYFDEESEMIYLRNRYYSPSNGRFITEDPIKDGLNWYVYCGGNPIILIDINGLSPRAYEPEKWNNTDVQNKTNCYAYALDFSGEITYGNYQGEQFEKGKPQPGQWRIQEYSTLLHEIQDDSLDMNDLGLYALSGAMLDAKANSHTFKVATEENIRGDNLGENEWVVMLVATSIPENAEQDWIGYYTIEDGVKHYYMQDYHWYRQNSDSEGNFDGTWSHKPGTNTVRNYDSSGSIITNPYTADRRTEYDSISWNGERCTMVLDYNVYVGAFVVGY